MYFLPVFLALIAASAVTSISTPMVSSGFKVIQPETDFEGNFESTQSRSNVKVENSEEEHHYHYIQAPKLEKEPYFFVNPTKCPDLEVNTAPRDGEITEVATNLITKIVMAAGGRLLRLKSAQRSQTIGEDSSLESFFSKETDVKAD